MDSHLPPPPRRQQLTPSPYSPYSSTVPETWSQYGRRKSSNWGRTAVIKGVAVSDSLGARVNGYTEALGSERFWPTTKDFPVEMDKAARILRAFTVDGVEHTVEEKSLTGLKRKRKVLKKIPSRIIRSARGLVIFSSMRSGIAPFGGAGGAGIIVARLPDGSWSAPSSLSPNNLTVGAMIGIDIYDCVLVIRTQKALDSFSSHKATLGGEFALVAGAYGSGAAVELGIDRSPVLSYIKSRGLYVGVEAVAQVFIERREENEVMYYWPGVRAGDILAGKVKVPEEASGLMKALADAETGRAQRIRGLEFEFEEDLGEIADTIELEDGEVLRLPPTPTMCTNEERDDEIARAASEPRKKGWWG